MIALRVVLDGVSAPVVTGVALHALDLTRSLIATAPRGCVVRGFTPSLPDTEYDIIDERLPGLDRLDKSALDRRQLAAAWQHGFSRLPGTGPVHAPSLLAPLYRLDRLDKSALDRRQLAAAWQHGFSRLPGTGPVHAPSLLAPLYRHDRLENPDEQTIVTIHDTAAWSHPEVLTSRGVAWHRAMVRRAHRYADAVVVPTHAVADELDDILSFGDRIRVIPGAVGEAFHVPADADDIASRLTLPNDYIALAGALDTRSGLPTILDALELPGAPELPLVVMTDAGSAAALADAIGNAERRRERVRVRADLSAEERAVVLGRATVAIAPLLADSFVTAALEAMSLGTPLVHTDQAALRETIGDSGMLVAVDSIAHLPEALAHALTQLVDDADARRELGVVGQDRARAFTWRDAAEKTWQLHADL